MADIREGVLTRLTEIAEALSGVLFWGRNVVEIGDDQLPAAIVYDGDEEAGPAPDPGKGRRGVRHMTMTPQVLLIAGPIEGDGNIGTALGAMRVELRQLVEADATLRSLVGTNGDITYMGCQTDLGVGRSISGQMACLFAFDYAQRADQLAP